jgi:isopenicillin N synthase-like dioxygenase
MHRVVPASESPTEHRYSIAYFLRPENEVRYKDPEGREISAKEWHDNKYHTFTETHDEQAKTSILMGGMETWSKQGIAV